MRYRPRELLLLPRGDFLGQTGIGGGLLFCSYRTFLLSLESLGAEREKLVNDDGGNDDVLEGDQRADLL